MTRRVPGIRPVLAALLLLSGAVVLSDDHEAGCVDCHVETDEADLRINTLLDAKGHGRLLEGSNAVPDGCNHCHASDDSGAATPMRTLMHQVHYEVPDENVFVLEYDADCSHCHAMSDADGVVTIRTGEANWLEESDAD